MSEPDDDYVILKCRQCGTTLTDDDIGGDDDSLCCDCEFPCCKECGMVLLDNEIDCRLCKPRCNWN